MAARHVLLLDTSGLTAFLCQPDGPLEEGRFTAGADGVAAFAEFLQERRSGLFYLLTDVAEEGFQVEDLPYVLGQDRKEIVSRKLAQLYYGTPLSMAMSLGRGKEGRRDEKFIFAGLTGHAHVEPWLQALQQVEARLVGVFSVPQVVASLYSAIGGQNDPTLVMSIGSAGLRQSFFDHGQLRFSRLAPMPKARMEDIALACGTEGDKIYQYLVSQRLIGRDIPLKTLMLAHPRDFGALAEHYQNTQERRIELVDLDAASRKHGLKRGLKDSRAETLLVHLLARRPPRQQFAPEQDRRFYRLWQARIGINLAAAAILATGLFVGGNKGFELRTLTDENEVAHADLMLARQRYNHMLEALPKVAISMDDLRALIDREQLLTRRSPGPEPLLQQVSRGLGKVPAVELVKLQWRLANSPHEVASSATVSVPAAIPAGAQPPSTGNYAIADLQVQLPISMAVDHRSQLEAINGFVAAMSSPQIQVTVIALPFETESGKSIRSGETAANTEPPKSSLRLVMKL